jgi:large subunit ribosomal protein L24
MERKFNKIPKLHVKKGDTVKVLAGDDKNKSGRDFKSNCKRKRAVVEGVNMVTKHKKPDANNPNGSIIKLEAPLHLCKLMVMEAGKPTRIGRKAKCRW